MAKRRKKAPDVQTCRVCGCTEAQGCPPDGCGWVEPGVLCTVCAEIIDTVARERTCAAGLGGFAPMRASAFDRGVEAAIRAYRARLLREGI